MIIDYHHAPLFAKRLVLIRFSSALFAVCYFSIYQDTPNRMVLSNSLVLFACVLLAISAAPPRPDGAAKLSSRARVVSRSSGPAIAAGASAASTPTEKSANILAPTGVDSASPSSSTAGCC
ncbi:hypothetical protein PCANC_06802 [Puccinia coronata f. sp. avenae]|uniref:Uncharacterized protein n=1 Tax=Puccinia coronata f. sp. avenae TaxID=200324 RepID=A0A2N5UU07_9BASI|nr:hypothetical protein PCANC_06802 [Puccinia coronata f. sp. avenae]